MSKTEKFPEPYNLGSIKNQEYLLLLREIIYSASAEFEIESVDPVLDVTPDTRELHRTTNKLKKFDRQILHEFISDIPNEDSIKFKTLLHKLGFEKRWKKAPNEGASKQTIEIAICASTQVQEIPLLNFIAEYLKYCERHSFAIEAIKGHEDTVKKLLNEVENRSSTNSNSHKSNTDLGGFGIRWQNGICKIKPGDGKQHLRIPDQRDNLSLETPANLLVWQQHLTRFIGRKQELKLLQEWLDSPPKRSIQLIYGEGGVGKTCLAFHFAEEILGQDWQAGQADTDLAGDWCSGRIGMLLIIDYPEDRRALVAQLIRAVKDMPETKQKLRVLLLSRNRDFLETITAEAPGLVNRPINLVGLETEDEQWKLIKAVWDRLQDLKFQATDQGTPENQQSPLPIDNASLLTWQKQQALHSTPLMIMALALYLFENDHRDQQVFFDLKEQDVIRYLSKREERRITEEVENYKDEEYERTKIIVENLQSESVLLIKAMAAIVAGLNDGAIRFLVRDLKQHDLDYPPPDIKHLKKLSLWVDKQLPALKPDILAADFLVYCLEKFSENQESEWIFAAIGLTQLENSNVNNQQISDNFSRLVLLCQISVSRRQSAIWYNNSLYYIG